MLIPWVTFTEPEVAHVGLYVSDIAARGLRCEMYVSSLAENDRAICDGDALSAHAAEGASAAAAAAAGAGFVKVHVLAGSDEILGATIVASNAGDMISEITLAMQNKLGLGALGAVIHPYPVQAEATRAAGSAYAKTSSRRV